TTDPWLAGFAPRADHNPWRIEWLPPEKLTTLSATPAEVENNQPLHAAAIEHSDGYRMRAKIHKYASFTTLPLFAAQLWLGQSLYNTPANAGGKRTAHAVVGV